MRRSAIALLLLFAVVPPAAAQDGARASVNAVVAAKELQSHFNQLSAAQSRPDYSKPPASDLFGAIFNTPAVPKAGTIDPTIIALLVESYENAKHDDGGFAMLGEVGARAGNTSSFDARSHGFKRLSDMIKQIPGFEVQSRDGVTFVKHSR